MTKRDLKELAKRGLFHAFELGQRLGVDVLPRHFYSEIPDIRALRGSTAWKQPHKLHRIAGHELPGQLAFARECCARDVIAQAGAIDVYAQACERNGEPGYGPTEAVFLYAFIRRWRPKRIVQVGCGVSTAIILAAARDAGYQPTVISVDPFPTEFLKQAAAAGEIRLEAHPAQDVIEALAKELSDGDLLFVDSTHTVSPGSEVNKIILDVMPDLGQGVWVHFHDIMFPYDYPRRILTGSLFWHRESALLQAFLLCNARYRIQASLSMLHYEAPQTLKELLPSYEPAGNDSGLLTTPGDFPSATYLRVVT